MNLGRRTFVGAATAAVLVGGSALTGCARSPAAKAAKETAIDDLIASKPGTLEAAELDRLWAVQEHLAQRWNLQDLHRPDWSDFVGTKSSSDPSYLAEYRHALDLLGDKKGDALRSFVDQALGMQPSKGDDTVRYERVRRYVIGEFLALSLIRGSFRQFAGLQNYRGYAPGPRTYTFAKAAA